MRHLFEIWTSAEEDWNVSSIVINARSKNAKRRRGRFVWKTFEDLAKEPLHSKHDLILMMHAIYMCVCAWYSKAW